MKTTLYLIRHGATEANLMKPYRLQGRGVDGPLAATGIRQAELTRDLLAGHSINHFYASPMTRAMQTARVVAGPHRRPVQALEELVECDVGRWEGLSWDEIRVRHAEEHRLFMADPGRHGYLGGESFQHVAERVTPVFRRLLAEHAGETLLVVGHHVVNRVFLASLLGLSPSEGRLIRLDNCGISIVVEEENEARVATLNATFHLHAVQAAA